MCLQTIVVLVVSIFEIVTAEMTRQMHSSHMVVELSVVVVVFLAEVTPWMRQDLSSLFRTWITSFYMSSQSIHVVDSLLSDKDCSTLEANPTIRFFM